jgi:hypothetical protein
MRLQTSLPRQSRRFQIVRPMDHDGTGEESLIAGGGHPVEYMGHNRLASPFREQFGASEPAAQPGGKDDGRDRRDRQLQSPKSAIRSDGRSSQ